MPFELIQQYYPGPASASVSGGPVVPTPTHPLIKSAYAPLSRADVYLCNFETSRLLTLSGLSGVTLTTNVQRIADHGMVASPKDSITAFTASVTGSKSGYYMSVGLLLKNRGFTNSFTGTTTGAIAAAGVNDIGVFTLRKRFFDIHLRLLHLYIIPVTAVATSLITAEVTTNIPSSTKTAPIVFPVDF